MSHEREPTGCKHVSCRSCHSPKGPIGNFGCRGIGLAAGPRSTTRCPLHCAGWQGRVKLSNDWKKGRRIFQSLERTTAAISTSSARNGLISLCSLIFPRDSGCSVGSSPFASSPALNFPPETGALSSNRKDSGRNHVWVAGLRTNTRNFLSSAL